MKAGTDNLLRHAELGEQRLDTGCSVSPGTRGGCALASSIMTVSPCRRAPIAAAQPRAEPR